MVETEAQVRTCRPRWELLQDIPTLGIIVTAPGADCDLVSGVFFPRDSLKEDPVTGSAHCTLVPYRSARLGKRQLFARQVSQRGGELYCEDLGARVKISGSAVLYAEGRISLPGWYYACPSRPKPFRLCTPKRGGEHLPLPLLEYPRQVPSFAVRRYRDPSLGFQDRSFLLKKLNIPLTIILFLAICMLAEFSAYG